MEKPDVDEIEASLPPIAIRQKNQDPQSQIDRRDSTELYDFLRPASSPVWVAPIAATAANS